MPHDNRVGDGHDFAQRLSQALTDNGHSLTQVRGRLQSLGTPVSEATLSNWQTGRSLPTRARSMRALENLEVVLGLDAGHLLECLPDASGRWEPTRVLPALGLVQQALVDLELDVQPRWVGLSTSDLAIVGANGAERVLRSAQVVRAQADGMRTFPAVYQQDAAEPCVPEVVPLSGCRSTGQIEFPEQHLVVVRMELSRPLSRGEVHHHSLEVHWEPTDALSHRVERGLPNQNAFFVQEVRFEGRQPRRAKRYHLNQAESQTLPDLDFARVVGDPLPLLDGELQQVVSNAAIGVHGICWEW